MPWMAFCIASYQHIREGERTEKRGSAPGSGAFNARLVTLTTDPDYDTPAELKRYGERFGADFSRWMFLTGTKTQIGALGSGSLKLSAVPKPPADQTNAVDLFIHTTIFVAVDKHARLRGIFETLGEGIEWTNVQPRIVAAVRQLEREP